MKTTLKEESPGSEIPSGLDDIVQIVYDICLV